MELDSDCGDPFEALGPDDRQMVLQLVLASGSLKDLARHYGVSYPTIRARLDRLIARLKAVLENRPLDPMAQLLGDLVERGQISSGAARSVLDAHRKLLENTKGARKEVGND